MASIASSEAAVTVDVHAGKGLVGAGHKYLDVRCVHTTTSALSSTPDLIRRQRSSSGAICRTPSMFLTCSSPHKASFGKKKKNPEFLEQVSLTCNKDDHILVGCQSGARSITATEELLKSVRSSHLGSATEEKGASVPKKRACRQKNGFKNVKNMGGGFAAWVENGLPVKPFQEELY
ncbi:hypothetical protein C4D60_Mb08t13870 [Musa balbisiana]|uniref:Rhodanese domain-containing protein n=1 Tax=Musa balbisiana TaxID=52838 RepID=A0A4S8K3K8_MUSBA|nr:hypothetical protein C4D60_Mb08t13870 [Musa balbisiana]